MVATWILYLAFGMTEITNEQIAARHMKLWMKFDHNVIKNMS